MTHHSANRNLFKYSLWSILIIITFKDTLTGYPFNSTFSIRYFEDIIILALYFWMGYDIIKRRHAPHPSGVYLIVFSIIFILHAMQTVIGIDLLAIPKSILTIRDNFWFFPILYFSIRYLHSNDIAKATAFFLAIQILFVLFQLLYHGITQKSLLWEDDINGSLGANTSHILAYSLILIAPIIATSIKKRQILILLLSIIIVLASARSAIIFSALVFPAAYLARKFSIKRLALTTSAVIIILIPTYNFLNNHFEATLNLDVLFDQQNKELGEGIGAARLSFLKHSIAKADTAEEIFFGHGPASYSSRSALALNGKEYEKFNQEYRFINEFITGGSTYNAWIVENGYILTFIFALTFLYPVFALRKTWYASATFLVLFLGISVQKLMESYSVGLLYWMVLAYFLLIDREKSFNLQSQRTY